MIRAVLTDIEGTTSSIAFVHQVLFPYARERLPVWLAAHGQEPAVQEQLGQVRLLAGNSADLVEALRQWIDEDRKMGPLKTLQGWIWEEGFRDGALRSHLYPEVASRLGDWKARGLKLAVYSSGSVHAQQQFFGHSPAGDLRGLFSAWFDTTTGMKSETSSYEKIRVALGLPAAEIIFLSDVQAELDAALAAGMQTTWLVREGLLPARSEHRTARTFDEVRI